MPDNIERYAYPLMIVAAVATLWYFFKPQSPVVATVTNPGNNWGAIPPLEQVLTAPSQLAQGPATIIEALRSPYSTAPGTSQTYSTPSYLTYNMPALVSMLPSSPVSLGAPKGNVTSCGCGGKCGSSGIKSCSSCESPCDSINARFPDGRGGCMTSRPDTAAIPTLARGLQNFLDMERGYAGYA